MKKYFLIFFLLSTLACNFASVPTPTPATATEAFSLPTTQPTSEPEPITRPFPQHVTYSSNSILPNHRTQEQLDSDLISFYEYWKENYVVADAVSENGIQTYRIAFGKSDEAKITTVSEGQGYGMMIVPIMAGYDSDAQMIFDGLWEFVKAHPSEVDSRLMDWNVPDENGNDSAFDGDADIAFGLLLADAQWGSNGTVNYKADAENMIAGILESTIGKDSHLPLSGDWVNVGENEANQFTPRSSDFMLANFRAFRNATNNPIWDDVILQIQQVMLEIQNEQSPSTGLLPDFIVHDETGFIPAPPYFMENVTDGDYNYNAGRDPWRVGLDVLLHDDPTSREIVQKISHWIETSTNGDPSQIRSGYQLSGEPLPNSDYFSSFFVSPMGIAAMTDPNQQEWLNAIYDAVYNTRQDYYEDSVTLLCLMVMTGNFWSP